MREHRQRITRRAFLCASVTLSALLVVGGLAACGDATSAEDPAAPGADAARFVVLEGLPSQAREGALLKSELASKPTVSRGGFPFYEAPVAVPQEVADTVRATLGASSTFMPYRGPKECGPFHPDWFVSLRDGSGTKTYLICFGCREVIVGEGDATDTYDIAEDAFRRLRDSLSKLRTNRPEGE